MYKKIILSLVTISTLSISGNLKMPDILKPNETHQNTNLHSIFKRTGPTIQIGILLDTSGSMNGLIDQARDQIWKIVNEVSKANKNNQDVTIQVGLFEYGKDDIPQYEGYVRMLSPLTSNLDKVSEQLFKLYTNGGEEYAGKVILESVNRFAWSDNKDDLKILIIAGNEPFTQGNVPYQEAIKKAKDNNIVVNTIFCGNRQDGINTKWAEGAYLGNGKYFNINHNDKRQYIQTPYDDRIIILGNKLNVTYVQYGNSSVRKELKENTAKQDKNSLGFSKSSYIERNLMKSKKQFAPAASDMVSSFIADEKSIDKIQEQELPSELQGKNKKEIKQYIKLKKEEREKIQKEINDLEKKREKFLSSQKTNKNDLGTAIIKTIRTQAENNGFKFK